MQTSVVIIGAGPAGLTAAYLLAKEKVSVTVLEADPVYVGGIARTATYKGYCFDIGGHRFFSKAKEVEDFWTEILGDDLLTRPRLSRIFYKKQYFSYPLKFFEVLSRLGIMESFFCFISYVKAAIFPVKNPRSFADWVSNHFGKRLFSIFFKTYTEKVWGMPCEKISADWAAQRIKGLSLVTAAVNALFPKKNDKSPVIKTLIDSFRYPRKGPGMMWETCSNKIKNFGGKVELGKRVIRCEFDGDKKIWTIIFEDQQGEQHAISSLHLISTAPIRELVMDYLRPALPDVIQQAAFALKYRDFLIVILILKDKKQFSDNWIYIHDPDVDVARIQNFKSWSPEMVPDPSMCCYGMEYFCFEGDGMWEKSDAELIQKAKAEIVKVGLANAEDVEDGCVVRQVKAYPVYDENYKEHVEIIRRELDVRFPTLHLTGRNGMHKYNNQDHAMMTAMLTVKNILAGENYFNIWNVNQDAEYHESGKPGEHSLGRDVPIRIE
ncbi:MAG TPA: NAD(P)/FAD-dependent oxidoreductase [Gammaproteobacteria bacterium]|nr:NAD(P)/FAD-dependent oxidoreductase [Gammaproteobacteria bacterium]